MESPLVTIHCLVYNHEPYLRQCLDGFVMQKTNFKFEAIVHDDCSTDGSAEIIREYAERFPNIIKPIYEEENQYSKDGFWGLNKIMLTHTKGTYIAFCEGDDYWTDELKLQKQVDILEENIDCGLVHTQHVQFIQDIGEYRKGWAKVTDLDKNLISNKMCTLTVCCRSCLYKDFFQESKFKDFSWPMLDAPLWIYILSKSKSLFIPEVTGVYRCLKESSSHSTRLDKNLDFLLGGFEMKLYFIKLLHKEYLLKQIAIGIVQELKRLSYVYDQNINFNFISFFLKYKIYDPKLFLSTFALKSKFFRYIFSAIRNEE